MPEEANPYTLFKFGLIHMDGPTALFVFIIFWIVAAGLHFLLFKPIIRTLENREIKMNQLNENASNSDISFEAAEQKYMTSLKEAKAMVHNIKSDAKDSVSNKAQAIIQEAKGKASKIMESAEKELTENLKIARQDAEKITSDLAKLVYSKVLGHS